MKTKSSAKKINIIVAVLILLTGIVIGGYLVLKSGKISAGELGDILRGQSIDLSLCEPNENDSTKDSDNDGLKDWQEIQLYKTNPCKQDSDGDGYFDGEEVASGYDPAKKAPGDELPGTTPKTPRPLPDNLTIALQQKLAEQLRQDRISPLDTKGNLLSSEELEQFPGVQQAVWEITQHKGQLFASEPIDESQIKILTNNSRQAIQQYAQGATLALFSEPNSTIQTSQSEAEIFQKAMESNNFTELDFNLNNLRISYEKLKTLAVPSDLLPLHKEQLNIFSSLIKCYEAIRNINDDPLKANLALQKYQEISRQFSNWLQKLADFIGEHQK